ncbi:MAG TPA: biotin-dependent carboxyltransferase family protein [Bryobacteraceae bacterium]|nr:biotin-dependent carboxyltransferase family protein [Bryobacteraceae bacterium]
MRRVVVESPGLLATVQDLGRPGYGLQGVSRAGAADALALRIGNRLLRNAEGAAAIEMTLTGGRFVFPEGAEIALTGAAEGYSVQRIAPGETLRLGSFVHGARGYLCVRGGLAVPRIASSASTHLLSGLGGGPLRKGEVLPIGPAHGEIADGAAPMALRTYSKELRVTRGPQADWFDCDRFAQGEYEVSTESNRMGLRLTGEPIVSSHDGQMVTEGVALGAIQVPAGGQPILLFVDQQTTGGYPKIANVITADLPSVGQLRPRDRIRFQFVSPEEALAALRAQEALLACI